MTTTADALRSARQALAELFLDSELGDADFERLATVLADSDLSVTELERIYADELAPVLHGNLKTTAGEWSGFDMAWLESAIAASAAARAGEGTIAARVRRAWQLRETRADWQRLKRMIEERIRVAR